MSEILIDEYTETELCQIDGPDSQFPPFETFADEKRSTDKTRLIKFLTYHPEGVPIVRVVKAILPSCSTERIAEREYSNTDYQFVRRFFERSEYVNIESDTSVLTAYPQPAAFHLTQ